MAVPTPPARIYLDRQTPESFKAFVAARETVRQGAADTGLEPLLIELVNLRVSQINGCAYCLSLHTRKALRAGETTQRLGTLSAWRDTELFTARERAALALAEAATAIADAAAQDTAYAAARPVLTDDEIAAVLWVAITMNTFNRVSILSKHPVRPAVTAQG
ncbi:MAG: carboxymuconolactone decarboxylase family protein [Streptomycetaceae bacterium]|jgi:AhpD family alkylhydroperoxidase|nr:carboxymuconolactone decarboxylase family protein [Streptomycetaceae bacterium]NUS57570.1 carboxymuconolactone decarboxylase family protein [Streptomycetaceae bacterium]